MMSRPRPRCVSDIFLEDLLAGAERDEEQTIVYGDSTSTAAYIFHTYIGLLEVTIHEFIKQNNAMVNFLRYP